MIGVAEREWMSVGRRGDAITLVTQITDALSGVTGFTYDPNGKKRKIGTGSFSSERSDG